MTSSQSALRLVLHGDVSERALKELAYRTEDALAALPEVSRVGTVGVRAYEISIDVPLQRLKEVSMHASTLRRLPRGRVGRILRRLCFVAGINPRRCFCWRCVAASSGLFHYTRVRSRLRAYTDLRMLGVRIVHRFAFELP
ncbi:MAG: hypothetical protein OXG04_10745 [Acidobacteria bacterium]|nr:hypothetical protein [Acidobacteriota bacterium]